MSGSISAHPVAHVAASATVAPPASADASKQRAALNRLLHTYSTDIQQGQQPAQLASLGRQIASAARAIGQNVNLPQPSGQAAAASAPVTPGPGKVDTSA